MQINLVNKAFFSDNWFLDSYVLNLKTDHPKKKGDQPQKW